MQYLENDMEFSIYIIQTTYALKLWPYVRCLFIYFFVWKYSTLSINNSIHWVQNCIITFHYSSPL